MTDPLAFTINGWTHVSREFEHYDGVMRSSDVPKLKAALNRIFLLPIPSLRRTLPNVFWGHSLSFRIWLEAALSTRRVSVLVAVEDIVCTQHYKALRPRDKDQNVTSCYVLLRMYVEAQFGLSSRHLDHRHQASERTCYHTPITPHKLRGDWRPRLCATK